MPMPMLQCNHLGMLAGSFAKTNKVTKILSSSGLIFHPGGSRPGEPSTSVPDIVVLLLVVAHHLQATLALTNAI